MFGKRKERSTSEENAFYILPNKHASALTTPIEPRVSKTIVAPQEPPVSVPASVPVSVSVAPVSLPIAPQKPCGPASVPLSATSSEFLLDPIREDTFIQVDLWHRKPENHLRPLLVVSEPGHGATCLVTHYGPTESYEDQSISDFLTQTKSFLGLKVQPAALFDCIEHLDSAEKSALKACLFGKTKVRRTILLTNSLFIEPAKSWQTKCQVLKLGRPSNSFVEKVLQSRFRKVAPKLLKQVADQCKGNLASAVNSMDFLALQDTPKFDKIVLDPTMDLVRTTSSLLAHQDSACIGGTSDCSMIGQLLFLNGPKVPGCTIGSLAMTQERFSQLDMIETSHSLDHESLWTLLHLGSKAGPKLQFDRSWRLDWPKSLLKKQDLYSKFQ